MSAIDHATRRDAIDAAYRAFENSTTGVALTAQSLVEATDPVDIDWNMQYLRRLVAERKAARAEWQRLIEEGRT